MKEEVCFQSTFKRFDGGYVVDMEGGRVPLFWFIMIKHSGTIVLFW